MTRLLLTALPTIVLGCAPQFAVAAEALAFAGPTIGPVPVEFVLFGIVLAGVALFHHHTLPIALGGAIVIALYKIVWSPFKSGSGVGGFVQHLGHEWVILINLLLLLLGFALLAKLFEDSEVPAVLPRWLPDDWKGCFVLLVLVFVLSSFLDNIAAAMIGGAIAHTVFKGKVHIGYLAAIVAASNAGGAGSVVGDTTTTMMWIAGISPLEVLEAFIASGVALVVFGIPAALQQQKYSPIQKDEVRQCAHRLGAGGDRRVHPGGRGVRQRVDQHPLQRDIGRCFRSLAPPCGWRCCSPRGCAGPTGRCCPAPSRDRSSCSRSCCAPR